MYIVKGFILGTPRTMFIHVQICICVVSDLVLDIRVHVDVGIHLLPEFCNHFSPVFLFLFIFLHACLVAMVMLSFTKQSHVCSFLGFFSSYNVVEWSVLNEEQEKPTFSFQKILKKLWFIKKF